MRTRQLLRWVVSIALSQIVNASVLADAQQGQAVKNEAAKIKETWKVRIGEFTNTALATKSFVAMRATILKELLNQSSTNAVEAEFRRVCACQVPPFEMDYNDLDKGYDTVLLQALAARSIDQKDRVKLVTLLSHNCPRLLEHLCPVEYYLADKWPDSIELVFECCQKANSEPAKKELLALLGRAFPSLRAQYAADSSFVAEVKRWYDKNRATLRVQAGQVTNCDLAPGWGVLRPPVIPGAGSDGSM